VTFPVHDLRGKVVTFGARALSPEDTPKYLNGPETVVFRKSSCLFALDRARDAIRRADEALLMEGYTDVLMAHLHGVERAVAGMGTAFTSEQAALLRRFAARVVLVYDSDAAGRTAAERTLEVLLERGLEVRVASLPEGRDVDEILLEEGPAAFEAVLRDTKDVLAFKLECLRGRVDLSTPAGRARAAESLVQTVTRVPSIVERDQYLREIAQRLGGVETEGVLRREAARLASAAHRGRFSGPGAPSGGPGGGRPGSPGAPRSDPATVVARVREGDRVRMEQVFLAGALLVPALRPGVFRAVGTEDFAVPAHQRVYKTVLGLEGEGKPYDLRTVAALMADDPEAADVLASLPEDPTLEDLVPSQIAYLERTRRNQRRVSEILASLPRAVPRNDPESPARTGLEAGDPHNESHGDAVSHEDTVRTPD
jgi:DNA primase